MVPSHSYPCSQCPPSAVVPRGHLLPPSPALDRGDEHHECCNVTVKQQNPDNITHILYLSRHCLKLWRSDSRACACLREHSLR